MMPQPCGSPRPGLYRYALGLLGVALGRPVSDVHGEEADAGTRAGRRAAAGAALRSAHGEVKVTAPSTQLHMLGFSELAEACIGF